VQNADGRRIICQNSPQNLGDFMRNWICRHTAIAVLLFACSVSHAQEPATHVTLNWDKVEGVSKTTPTLQVVVSPLLERDSPIHDRLWGELARLGADNVRYIPWMQYPKLNVAELEPPAAGKTSWDFSLIDPMTIDFLEATKGHPIVMDFSTIPQWMWKTDKPVAYPADPDQIAWNYIQGTEPRDPTFTEVANYYARLLAWYTQGGFTDELGQKHVSGYHYAIPIWEVLNEVDGEHEMSPETYTKLYDAVVTAMRKVQPDLKFVGMSLKSPSALPHFVEYFLDPKNHQPGIPLDYISYHFYAMAESDVPPESQGPVFFARADGFLNTVRYIEAIRQRLAPHTGTMINEIGAFAEPETSNGVTKPLSAGHLERSATMYAYLFGELTRAGIDVAGASLFVGYAKGHPSASMVETDVQRRSISMVDWKTGAPNVRFRV
jgi:hypothetical protein